MANKTFIFDVNCFSHLVLKFNYIKNSKKHKTYFGTSNPNFCVYCLDARYKFSFKASNDRKCRLEQFDFELI